MSTTAEDAMPRVLIHLLKGLVERDSAPEIWQTLAGSTSHVRDYFGPIGLDLVLDEADGYAYLTQRPATEGEPELPRLVARRSLSYRVSLLLALLRKRLAEHDASSGDARLVLTAAEITDLVRLFLPDTANEAKLDDRVGQDPDQTGAPAGGCRFILSLRAVGEGHISSLTFRSGSIGPDGSVTVDPTARLASVPKVGSRTARPAGAMSKSYSGLATTSASASSFR